MTAPADSSALLAADHGQGWPDRLAARIDERLTRLGLTGEFRRDCALAVLVFLGSLALLSVLFTEAGRPEAEKFAPFQLATLVVVLCAQALPLCIRRLNPALCLWMVVAMQVALLIVLPSGIGVRGVAPFVAAYTCGVLLSGRRAARTVIAVVAVEWAAFALAYAMSVVTGTVDGSPGSVLLAVGAQLLSTALTYILATMVGGYVATRRSYLALVQLRAAEAIRAQRAMADAAIGLERSRMARELHDVAAHHLSGMVVQAAVVERLIDRDPAAAKEAAAWVRGQGKETLHNLRLVVGALREPGAGEHDPDLLGDGDTPVPGLAVLDRLIRTAGELGTPIERVSDGDPRELPPIADVTFYRVAQEALSNAREHAPGAPVRLRLRYRAAEVSLQIDNDAPVTPDPAPATDGHRGYGLVGMKERAQMLGATFEAGPTPAGGWRVLLTLPLDADGTGALR